MNDVGDFKCYRCGLAQANGWLLESEKTLSEETGKGQSPNRKMVIELEYRPYCRDCNTEMRHEKMLKRVERLEERLKDNDIVE